MWKLQLKGKITLLSTELEYTSLSYALRQAIPIINSLKEMKKQGYEISKTKSEVKCQVFEDNSGVLEIAKAHK